MWMHAYEKRREEITSALEVYSKKVLEVKQRVPVKEVFTDVTDGEAGSKKLACFVDGGEGFRELLGAGAYFIRASALVWGDGSQEFLRDLDLGVISYDEHTKERVELLREAMECRLALKAVRERKPELIFLDGSLHVKNSLKPLDCKEYEDARSALAELLDYAKNEGVRLAGVSEDSKSRQLLRFLNKKFHAKFPAFMTDPMIMELLAGERAARSVEFVPPSGGTAFKTAYLKPSATARPLRVDAPEWEQDFDGVISEVAALSRGSRGYGYPLPLYLAHLDARITPKHADWASTRLQSHVMKNNPKFGKALMGSARRSPRLK